MSPSGDADAANALAADPTALDRLVAGITRFVADRTAAADAEGVVVVLSGRLHSTVVAMLAVEALGPDRVFGLVLPAYMRSQADAMAAELVAEGLGIEYAQAQLLPFVHCFHELSVPGSEGARDVRATASALDRLRAACAWYAADVMDRLVLGTADRTAFLLGTADGGEADLWPLGDCYRTEVVRLADHLGIPAGVCEPADDPLASLPVGEVAPETVDAVLSALVEADLAIDATAEELGVGEAVVRALAARHVRRGRAGHGPVTPASATTHPDDRFHELELHFE